MSNITGMIEKGGSMAIDGIASVTEKVTVEGKTVMIPEKYAAWIMIILIALIIWKVLIRR